MLQFMQAKRIEDLRNDVSKLEYSLAAAKAEYERIAAINQQVYLDMSNLLDSALNHYELHAYVCALVCICIYT